MTLMILSAILRRSTYAAALSLFIICAWPHTVSAGVYGKGNFGSCTYQKCRAPTSTQATLPSGLEISVNLTQGQIIPNTGYTIVVTPLNGVGSSFQKVDFYINGVLIQTVTPDETGTARWFWNPTTVPGTTVKMVVSDGAGNTTTREFDVTIAHTAIIYASPSQDGHITTTSDIGHTLQHISEDAKQIIRSLPKPIAYSFPYILYILLGVNVGLLLLQTQRELAEYHTLQALVARQRSIATSKKTLLELLAHYFRTPLTVLFGGTEMLPEPASAIAIDLKKTEQHLRVNVERLLEQTRLTSEPIVINEGNGHESALLWRQPGLLLPLLLIAAIVIPFNYLARTAGTLNITQINLDIQFVVYALLAVVSYQVFRRLQLQHRDSHELQRIATEEQAAGHIRDKVITSGATNLRTDMTQLDRLIAQLPESKAGSMIRNGESRLHELLAKFTIASQLHGAQSGERPKQFKLSTVVAKATQTLASEAAKRRITIQQIADAELSIKNPELFTFVVRSILDNALAYSPDNSVVQIMTDNTAEGVTVTISDSGKGIPSEKLPILFQPFSKAEGAEVFTHEGMGFSLYLDKLIMSYLGGSIVLDSKPSHGTVVTLRLPPMPEIK
jgi:signal transduction histidine kinase